MKLLGIKTLFPHLCLIICVLFFTLPLYLAIVAASHDSLAMIHLPLPHFPGRALFANLQTVWSQGIDGVSCGRLLWNSFWMAMFIAIGKMIMALMTSFSLIYFSFPFKRFILVCILMTLMLPIEVRLVPTYEVVVFLQGLNSLWGLTLPLMVSATAILLFRAHFSKLPPHLVDAAKLDGAGPMRFFIDILLPLAKAPMGSLFVILFIYGWNQYLWPLVLTTDPQSATIVMGMRYLSGAADLVPEWNLIMSMVLIALLPPCLVLFTMQRSFEQGMQ
jgi:sn-glycerol 3-phosphate transport system permease protein